MGEYWKSQQTRIENEIIEAIVKLLKLLCEGTGELDLKIICADSLRISFT